MNLGAPASLPANCWCESRRRGRRRSRRRLAGSWSQCTASMACGLSVSQVAAAVKRRHVSIYADACARAKGDFP